METKKIKITVIGGGNMGGAIVRGLAKGNLIQTENISLCDKQPAVLTALKSEYPQIATSTFSLDFVREADIIIVALKPHLVKQLGEEIRLLLNEKKQILVSIAAGVCFKDLETFFGAKEKPLFRVIPNVAIEFSQGVSTICSSNALKEEEELISALFQEFGKCFFVSENQLDAMMALSSCGIAYAFRYIQAAMMGATEMGIQPSIAKEAILQTLRGAVEVLETKGTHPEEEIERVSTPGGFTIKGLNEMEAEGFSNAVIKGLKASSPQK